jgi:thiol-disulfide isomerase/thioredoxin
MKNKVSLVSLMVLSVTMFLAAGCSSTRVENTSPSTQTQVSLTHGNYKMVKAGAEGKSYGFRFLLGIIPITAPSTADARADLYSKLGQDVTGRSVALVNVTQDRSTTWLLLFSIPKIVITGDVVEFAEENPPPAANNPPEEDIRASVHAGDQALPFDLKAIDGSQISFPGDYKGKVVLLDFWATWCPPCREELPNVVAAYQKYHTNGFDVVSVSLDRAQQDTALLQFVHDHNMTWPQIYDGGYWKAAVAKEYGVRAIPCPVVVDGDTGKILAVGADAVGPQLDQILATTLTTKSKE